MKGVFMKKILRYLPDKVYIQLQFLYHFRRFPNLKNPQTYNEKLQWLKLYDRKPEYTTMVDKNEVKQYVANKIGEQYIIPTLGVWNSFDEIDFEKLPNQFVLKCTHDSGSIVICRDKSNFDLPQAKLKLENGLSHNGYWYGREWPYKNVTPKIIAEQYLEDKTFGELRDYKFFCFGGKVKMMFIATERQSLAETKFDFYDRDFNHLDLRNGHPNATIPPSKPKKFDEMINLAEKLSEDVPHLRVDFYEVDGNIYFGELTFSHWSGMCPFEPEEWDKVLGSWITLPNVQ